MEDEPAPAVDRLTLFQIENGRVRVLRTQGRKPYSFSAVKKLHAEYIPIELHGGFHVRDSKRTRRIFFNNDCHIASSLPSPPPGFSPPYFSLSSAKFPIFLSIQLKSFGHSQK